MSSTHVALFVFALCSQLTYAVTIIDTGDKLVLEILFNTTNGPAWRINPFNFSSNDCDDFSNSKDRLGAICDNDGMVTELYLDGNNLVGEIPSQLGDLSELTELRLDKNILAGEIPSQLGNLIKLTHLYLDGNNLAGEIPSQLGDLIELTELYLDGNNLAGEIPSQLGDLIELTELILYSNQLTGEIPSQLGNLMKLTDLELDENGLSGVITDELSSLTKLVYLWLNGNELTGAIPNFLANFTLLEVLHLEDNCFSCPFPEDVEDLCAAMGNCHIGTCGECCQVYLPAPPVDDGECETSPCENIDCDGCPILDCENSTVVLYCVNSVWNGPIQEDDYICKDPCNPNPCFNGGSCVNETDGFRCSCEEGFAGTSCEINIVCANITCNNGATHFDGHMESQCCCCATGFSGTRCENRDRDSCVPNPCLNDGACTNEDPDGDNDFACICQDGYEGKICEIDTDDCANDPCENRGTCHDQKDSFSCCCDEGFAGDTCELKPCRQPYYIDPFGNTVKRELDNCADSDLVKARKKKYDNLVAERRNEERYATLTHVAYIAGPALIGAAVGFAAMKLLGRR